jgi:hypothetical protein
VYARPVTATREVVVRAFAGSRTPGRATSVLAFGGLALLFVTALATGASPQTKAKTKTLGEPAKHVGSGLSCGDCTQLQIDSAKSSPQYIVPKGDWKITSWRAHGLHKGDGVGHARLRIFRPTGVDGQYELVKESDVEKFPVNVVTKHRTSLKVQEGDHLALTSVGDFANVYDSNKERDVTGGLSGCGPESTGPMIGTGTACPINETSHGRMNLSVKMKKL